MQTPTQVAKKANVSAQSIRNYSTEYADLLSKTASRTHGPRLYTDEDVQVLCTIAYLRRAGVPRDEIAERIHNEEVPPLIEVSANAPSPLRAGTPSTEPQQPLKTASNEALVVHVALSTMQRQIDALQRQQRSQARQMLWSHGVAFYLGMVTMGLIFYIIWWAVNGGWL